MYPQSQTGDYFAATSVGQMVVSASPIVAASRAFSKRHMQMNGLGQFGGSQDGWAVLGVIAAVAVVATGALCYQAGKAMAPNRSEAKTWGWVGVPVGMLAGPWGLGVMGIISNSKRRG
jgi:hypothetical protein